MPARPRHPLQRQNANLDDAEVPTVLKNRKLHRVKYIILDGRFFPLNILATLLVATSTVYLFEQGGLKRWHGILVFMAGGCIVEGNWFAVAVCMTAYRYCQSPTVLRLSSLMASLAVLGLFINANQWALAVLPVILIAPHVRISLKRQWHFFYGFYPAHLAVILLVRTAIGIQ
jgi:hypothetical protein